MFIINSFKEYCNQGGMGIVPPSPQKGLIGWSIQLPAFMVKQPSIKGSHI